MAGRGGAQKPDYKPRVGGIGAAAQRMDMTRGTGAQPGTTALNKAPTPGVTGSDGPYGQRTALQQVAGGAPRAGARPPGRPPAAGGRARGGGQPGLLESLAGPDEDADEPFVGAPGPLEDDAFAGYSPRELRRLEQYLPMLTSMAADPAAGPEIALLAQLAAEIVMHNQEVLAGPPTQQYIGPAPERLGP